eukprot:CAMPEP_0182559966 /NCGR_PEP_ID=MMETSP1324-20130603/2882_1 /TAXON_ID=236786 /ORGANISM="Florenciella sp., Strain RCC1587" /LENGTH=58 /DNA_ID=CAMNT_0024772289 /DNA_START=59 /DNA_END=232 /DNA_ORIENTATION=+
MNCGPEVRKELVQSVLAENEALTVLSLRPKPKNANGTKGTKDGEEEHEEEEDEEEDEE